MTLRPISLTSFRAVPVRLPPAPAPHIARSARARVGRPRSSLRVTRLAVATAILIGLLPLQACSVAQVAGSAAGATVFVGKVAVKGTVGAGKLAVKGTRLAFRKSEKPMTCADPQGGTYVAPRGNDGLYFCPTSYQDD